MINIKFSIKFLVIYIIMDIKKMQEKLNLCHKLNKKFDDDINLIKLENAYQKYINKFSPAYLSGSPWYVGPSILSYINNKKINTDLLSFLFLISNKIN